jgi:hypothetical protein
MCATLYASAALVAVGVSQASSPALMKEGSAATEAVVFAVPGVQNKCISTFQCKWKI